MISDPKFIRSDQKTTADKRIRYLLGSVLLFVALNAFGGGYYGLSGAKDIPTQWLNGSPFTSYFVPSLILFFIVGGSCFLAAIAVFKRHRLGKIMAFISGVIMLVWISVQLFIIGYVSWMQPAITLAAVFVLTLSILLPKQSHKLQNR